MREVFGGLCISFVVGRGATSDAGVESGATWRALGRWIGEGRSWPVVGWKVLEGPVEGGGGLWWARRVTCRSGTAWGPPGSRWEGGTHEDVAGCDSSTRQFFKCGHVRIRTVLWLKEMLDLYGFVPY